MRSATTRPSRRRRPRRTPALGLACVAALLCSGCPSTGAAQRQIQQQIRHQGQALQANMARALEARDAATRQALEQVRQQQERKLEELTASLDAARKQAAAASGRSGFESPLLAAYLQGKQTARKDLSDRIAELEGHLDRLENRAAPPSSEKASTKSSLLGQTGSLEEAAEKSAEKAAEETSKESPEEASKKSAKGTPEATDGKPPGKKNEDPETLRI